MIKTEDVVGLLGREGVTIRKTLLPTLYCLVFAGLIGLVAFYVLGVVDPLLGNN